jgi:L-ascorbate metabolism protein UlaG (beta-lactamase superfamily)
MKHFTNVLLVLCSASLLSAQRPKPDTLSTSKGSLIIQPVYHGCLVMKWGGKTMYVDPYGGKEAFDGIAAPDLIFITDIHPDHLDTATLNQIDCSHAIFVVPVAVAEKLPEKFKKKMLMLSNGDIKKESGVTIRAIPMYNLPEEPASKHVKGRGNGYLLTLANKLVYISGDTEDIPEMRSLKNVNVAFVCMNLPYTMDINQAASAVLEFKPRIVYPYHYRGKDGLSDTKAFADLVKKGNAGIDVRLRDWYALKP